MNDKLNEINKYLQNTYKTDKIKIVENDNKYFEYKIVFDYQVIDEINSLDTYDINNSIYYYLTGKDSLVDENVYVNSIKKELKKWIKI